MRKSFDLIWKIRRIIKTINKNIQEHKHIERKVFWKNFKRWATLLYESNQWWFFEGYFIWHVECKVMKWLYNYKILNKKTWITELCEMYRIKWFVE
jgi:hypothetical protein